MQNNSPFASRSSLTPRSPPEPNINNQPAVPTRSQVEYRQPTISASRSLERLPTSTIKLEVKEFIKPQRSSSTSSLSSGITGKNSRKATISRTPQTVPKPIIIKTEPTDDTITEGIKEQTSAGSKAPGYSKATTSKQSASASVPVITTDRYAQAETSKQDKTTETQKPETANRPTQTTPTKRDQKIQTQKRINEDPTHKAPETEPPRQQEQNKMALMGQKEIQKIIANFVPEFNGQDTPHRQNELSRFIGTADSILATLTDNEEKLIFDRLIMFRLTGDAYTRILHIKPKNYAELKKILQDMYSTTYSLEELEKKCYDIHQNYGETIRNYGYRLLEALQLYQHGYKKKYQLENIDDVYRKHLDTTAVQTFKRGLNNTILKDKVFTSKASNMEAIIDETERVEKMLLTTTNIQPTIIANYQPPQNLANFQNFALPTNQGSYKPVTCNYCQKPNHSWKECRTRLRDIQYGRSTYQTTHQRQMPRTQTPYPVNNSPNRYFAPQQQSNLNSYQQQYNRSNNFYRYPPQEQQNFNTYRPQNNANQNPNIFRQQSNYTQGYTQTRPTNLQNYQQPSNTNNYANRPQKYCSHCKTTVGHTFEECRNKLRTNQNYNNIPHNSFSIHRGPTDIPPNYTNKPGPTDNSDLEEQFSKMRINTIAPQQNQPQNPSYNQENSSGSSQL